MTRISTGDASGYESIEQNVASTEEKTTENISVLEKVSVISEQKLKLSQIAKSTTSVKSISTESRKETEKSVVTKININKSVYFDIPLSKSDQDFVQEMCNFYRFSPKLIYQIMFCESGFNPKKVSSTNDHGIMQLQKKYYMSYTKNNSDGFNYVFNNNPNEYNVYDVRHNVVVGIRILNEKRDFCNRNNLTGTAKLLQCYNQGGKGYLNNPKTEYSKKVMGTTINVCS